MSGSTAGYSGTPLPRKLGIKPQHRVATVGAPEGFGDVLGGLPDGVAFGPLAALAGVADVILLFVTDPAGLEAGLAPLVDRLDVDGGLWVAWPKLSSPLGGELRQQDVQRAGLAVGLVDNKVCAIDSDWSGLRFVFRREGRPAIRERRGAG